MLCMRLETQRYCCVFCPSSTSCSVWGDRTGVVYFPIQPQYGNTLGGYGVCEVWKYIHPLAMPAYPRGLQGGAGTNPSWRGGERWGTPRTGCQSVTGLTHRNRQPCTLTFTCTGNLEPPINLHVFGLSEETHAGTGRTCKKKKETKWVKPLLAQGPL